MNNEYKKFKVIETGWIFTGIYITLTSFYQFVQPVGCRHYGYGIHQVEEL